MSATEISDIEKCGWTLAVDGKEPGKELGSGHFAKVRLAQRKSDGLKAACKIIKKPKGEPAGYMACRLRCHGPPEPVRCVMHCVSLGARQLSRRRACAQSAACTRARSALASARLALAFCAAAVLRHPGILRCSRIPPRLRSACAPPGSARVRARLVQT